MNYKKTTLKNGLRILTAPMKDTQTATVMIMVGTGSRYEEKNEAGISHFLEHMMFKGTKKRPNTQVIANELDSIGGTFNAFTGKTKTGYYAKADAKHLDTILDVIMDIYMNSKIENKEIKRESGTILQELSMYEDLPMQSVDDVFEELLYRGNKLGKPIIGNKKTITSVRRKDFVNYMKKHYIASNTVICVAGKISEKKVRSLANKYFSKMKSAEKLEIERVEENQKKPAVKIKNKKTDQTHLNLGVRALHNSHEDRFTLSLLATILGGNMSSRMFTNIRERQGLAYYVRTETEAYSDVGYLMTRCGVEHKNLTKTIETIMKEYRKIVKNKVSEKELQSAKDYIKGKSVMGLESSDSVASYLIDQEVSRKKILTPEEIFKKLDKVTTHDIKRVAREIFVPEKLNLAIIGPHRDNKKLEKLLY
jgi:predicted Zn-dependent peptidase